MPERDVATPTEILATDGVAAHSADVDALVEAFLDTTGVMQSRDLLHEIVIATLAFVREDASRLDLKIARSAMSEMAEAFRIFAPYRDVPKVTMFGSARTAPSDALYSLAREVAHELADAGYMVVTGAGPGIMAAGAEGAGSDMTIGVNIQLPFESVSSTFHEAGERLVEMKYFFTRKLMLMKESRGFVVLPGGFGTLDECFELLTLLQTGKAEPAPVVLVDTPGDRYWESWQDFVAHQVYARGLADSLDAALYRITDNVPSAVEEILGFHRNYHSRRFVGSTMVIRLQHAPDDQSLRVLSAAFSDICSAKGIWRTEPLAAERQSHDALEYERIALVFDKRHHGRLRQLIDALNHYDV
jgi:uncharacterized protein (TIGR00730 family)